MLDLTVFHRFVDKGDCTLIKLDAKRENSQIRKGQQCTGDFGLHKYEATSQKPEQFGAEVVGYGFQHMRTSPIVKIIDQNETSVTFETEGAVYRVEKFVPVPQMR